MDWVETLTRRHFAERGPQAGQDTGDFAADLGMQRTLRDHHLMFTSKGPFIRPFCRKIDVSVYGGVSHKHTYVINSPDLGYQTSGLVGTLQRL